RPRAIRQRDRGERTVQGERHLSRWTNLSSHHSLLLVETKKPLRHCMGEALGARRGGARLSQDQVLDRATNLHVAGIVPTDRGLVKLSGGGGENAAPDRPPGGHHTLRPPSGPGPRVP